jgi:hypothetical protein
MDTSYVYLFLCSDIDISFQTCSCLLHVDMSRTKQRVGQVEFGDATEVGASQVMVHSLGVLSEKE